MRRLRSFATRVTDERGFGLVEALIALTILVIGLVAVSGLTMASGDQANIARWRSEQAAVAQLVLEASEQRGFLAAASGVDTLTLNGNAYTITRTVSSLSPRVRQVMVHVSGVGDVGPRTFTTRLYRPRPLPSPTP